MLLVTKSRPALLGGFFAFGLIPAFMHCEALSKIQISEPAFLDPPGL